MATAPHKRTQTKAVDTLALREKKHAFVSIGKCVSVAK